MINRQLHNIPDGDAGTEKTLNMMKDIIDKEKKNVNNIVLVRELTADLPEKDKVAETQILFDYVRNNVRYISDVYGIETLQDLDVTLRTLKSGDCDDHVIALSTLLEIAGIPTRLIAMQPVGTDGFTHVYLEALLNNQWIALDPIEKKQPMGWEYPTIKMKMILPVSMSKGEMQMYGIGTIAKRNKREEPLENQGWLLGNIGELNWFEQQAASFAALLAKGSMTIAEYSRKMSDLANARNYQATGEDVFKKKEAFKAWLTNPMTIIGGVAAVGILTVVLMKMKKK